MSIFGKKLKELRRAKGISQERLAKLVDYKRTNLSMVEAGSRSPSSELVRRLSLALGVPYEQLNAWKLIDSMSEAERAAVYAELKDRKDHPHL